MGIGLAAVGAIFQLQEGREAKAQADFEAAISAQQAERERRIAVGDEEGFRIAQARLQGDRRAGIGASGVQVGTGSPLDVSGDLAAEIELQALRIRQGGQVRGTRLDQQSQLSRRAGKNLQTRSRVRAGSTLLSGFGQSFGGGPRSTPDTSLEFSRGATFGSGSTASNPAR